MNEIVSQLENLNLNLIVSSRKKKDGSDSYILIDDDFFEYKTSCISNSEHPNCKGSVSTNGMTKPITNIREHDHQNTIKTKVKQVKSEIRQMAASQPDTRPNSNSPLSVSSDYELAIINSIQEVFPESEVCGCFFHLKKSIWRHVQENGLATKYSDFSSENLIRRHKKMLACLAFVPVDFVVNAFKELQSCIPNDLKKIFTYFEDNYIGPKKRTKVPSRKTPRFGLELWNYFERTRLGLPRTNNNLEGWHNAFQSTIRSHPHLLVLVDNLRLEQSNTENLYIKLSTGQINKRKTIYVILEEQITNIITDFNTVAKRDAYTLLNIIYEYILPDTII
ncbi:hypothetical protein BpHYR1_007717 [Brachionus plicatilis]|uniref:MULE transposase domain-containing protein n=1 Tax=Brachionus plicatilis TaxID=10195 RepID=A0A3M7PRE4_BRAPC|nr:hypothetical protein BpHYR1_007717 [Brachionus plicatilis]